MRKKRKLRARAERAVDPADDPAVGEAEDASAEDSGAEASSAEDAVADDASAEDASAEDSGAEDTSAEDAVADDASAEDASAEDAVDDASAEDAVADDASAEDAVAEASSAEDAVADDASAEDAVADDASPEDAVDDACAEDAHADGVEPDDEGDAAQAQPGDGEAGQDIDASPAPGDGEPVGGEEVADGALGASPDEEAAAEAAAEQVDADLAGESLPDDPDAELTPAFSIEPARLKSILESLLFAAEKPLSPLDLKRLTGFNDGAAIQAALQSLTQDYADRGVSLYDVAGGFQFRTHPDNSEYVQRLVVGRPVRLSRAQLETLAIVAYRQPVTRPEIDDIRGVDSGSTLKVLLDRSLIRVLGKKEEPGRPLLYGTSKEFLEFFNLSELRDLPTLREFHELTEESLREVEALDQAGQETEGEDASGAAGGGNGIAESADRGEGDPSEADEDEDDDGSSPSASH